MKEKTKKLILLGLVTICFLAIFFFDPYPQRLIYHDFADQRPLFGIKNSFNVLSNIPFSIAGIWGFLYMKKYPVKIAWSSWLVCFMGVFLVGFGSGYYHDTPNNQTLIWDRLPLTIGFMGLFSALMTTYISEKLEKFLLPITVLFGAFSVIYWAQYDDLRFYFYVQAIPLICIPFVIALFQTQEIKKSYIGLALSFYVLAKVLEFTDDKIFNLTGGAMSGHTLKHLFAAAAPLVIAFMFKNLHHERSRVIKANDAILCS